MLKQKLMSSLFLPFLFTGGLICQAKAVDEGLDEYTLDTIVVTAQRTETRDLNTPATTTVITAKDIENRGYLSVFDALDQTVGITSYNYSSGQGDNGSATGRVYVRGLDKGTLILVNGAPVNLNNYNSPAGIPISAVERIEIVKGSNSVLYGSEAMGGVVNIITKQGGRTKNTASVTLGDVNTGGEFTSQGDKYLVSVGREYFSTFHDSQIRYNNPYETIRKKFHKDNWFSSVNFAPNLTMNYMHTKTYGTGMDYLDEKGRRKKPGYQYDDKRDYVALIYDDKAHNLKSNLSYHRRRIDGLKFWENGKVTRSGGSSNIILSRLNFDTTKRWQLSHQGSLVTGFTADREKYEEILDRSHAITRDSLGLYTSYSHEFSDKFSVVLGLRAQFVKGNKADSAKNAYLPQLQTLYKIDEQTSWYTNIGKSFEMPAINSLYSMGGTARNDNLKPQEGWSYETGIKRVTDTSTFKVAVFTMKMDNKFAWRKYKDLGLIPPIGIDPDNYIQVNLGEFRNTGLEVEYTKRLGDRWHYNAGFTVQNPEAKDAGVWVQESSRWQMTTGVQYGIGKFHSSLNLFWAGDREDASKKIAGKYHPMRDKVDLNAVLSYTPDQHSSFKLNLYNLLNRDNVINVSENLARPFNWSMTYTCTF